MSEQPKKQLDPMAQALGFVLAVCLIAIMLAGTAAFIRWVF